MTSAADGGRALDQLCIDTIRTLCIDAIEAAGSMAVAGQWLAARYNRDGHALFRSSPPKGSPCGS